LNTYKDRACEFLSEGEKQNTSSLSSGQRDAVEEMLLLYLRGQPMDTHMAFNYMYSYTVDYMTIFQEVKDTLCKNKEWRRTYHFCIAEIIKTFSNKLFMCDRCRLALKLHPFMSRGDNKYESRYDAKLFPVHPNFAISRAKYRVYLENYFLYSTRLGVRCPKCHHRMTYPFYNLQLQLLSLKQYKHRNDSLFWRIVNDVNGDRFLEGMMRDYSDDSVINESIRQVTGLTPPLPPEMQSRRPDVVHPRRDIHPRRDVPPFNPQYIEVAPHQEPEPTEPEEELRVHSTAGLNSWIYQARPSFRPLISTQSEERLRELQRERIEMERGREQRIRESLARLRQESEEIEGGDDG